MKKTLTILLSSSIILSANYCEHFAANNILNNKIMATHNYQNQTAEELLNILNTKPYDDGALIELLKNLQKDSKILNGRKRRFAWSVLHKAGVFVLGDKAKKAYINFIHNNNTMHNMIYQPSYMNVLILHNLGLPQDAENLKEQIERVNYKDLSYHDLYSIFFGGSIKIKERHVSSIVNRCYRRDRIKNLLHRYKKTSELIRLFVYSKVFPQYEETLKAIYYAAKPNTTNIWQALEFMYDKYHNDYVSASKHLQILYGLENKPEYMRLLTSKIYNLASEQEMRKGHFYKAWSFAKLAVENLFKYQGKHTNEIEAQMIKYKQNLEKASKELIKMYIAENNQHYANHIVYVTNQLIFKKF